MNCSVNPEAINRMQTRKIRNNKKLVFAGAGSHVWEHKFCKMEDHPYLVR